MFEFEKLIEVIGQIPPNGAKENNIINSVQKKILMEALNLVLNYFSDII